MGTHIPRSGRNVPYGNGSMPGLEGLPAALLQRHGLRVLDPTTAATVDDDLPPQSTVYRARSLLIPDEIIDKAGLKDALKTARLELVKPDLPSPLAECQMQWVSDKLAKLPRAVTLRPLTGDGAPRQPVTVDAWVALQTLRAAVRRGPDHGAGQHPLNEADVAEIELNHAFVSTAIMGSPASDGGNPPGGGSSLTGPHPDDSYMLGGYDARLPVHLAVAPPARPAPVRRRPVVAILDTGVRAHPWLDVEAARGGGYITAPPDGFVQTSQSIQNIIDQQDLAAWKSGDRPRQVITGPWDMPTTDNPLVGELDTCTGHCTFCCGLIRQMAPSAQVLSLRIMHSDGIVYKDVLQCALTQLAVRVANAWATGNEAELVDVLSLSLGYFAETSADRAYTSSLKTLIDLLIELGVVVVAAAGNYATSRRFYPAGFATNPAAWNSVLSVGALNPNGTKALFSDDGHWVTDWAEGAAVVSTFPTDVKGSREPAVSVRGPRSPGSDRPRQALDPDDYSSGFAVWSGSSFAAPLLAGAIAGELDGRTPDEGAADAEPAGGQAQARVTAAIERARASLKRPA